MSEEEKELSEFTRERSNVLLKRRDVLPRKQDRPMSIPKEEADLKDLQELVETAEKTIEEISKGEAKSKVCIMTTDKIVIDPRARWKCIIPLCLGYNSSPCCPPFSPTHTEMQDIVSRYEYAVLIRYMPSVENHVYPGFLSQSIQHVNELNEIVSIVETDACYRGYYLAMGFKGGPCGACGLLSAEYVADWWQEKEVPKCPVLDGKTCHGYLRARPALEACGVNVFATARNAGWEAPYIIMPEHPRESVPCISWHGLVLVA
jgi:predicted metal-binding protein